MSYDIGGAQLFINVQVLVEELRQAFDQYEQELCSQPELRDRYYRMTRKTMVEITRAEDQKAWEQLLSLADQP